LQGRVLFKRTTITRHWRSHVHNNTHNTGHSGGIWLSNHTNNWYQSMQYNKKEPQNKKWNNSDLQNWKWFSRFSRRWARIYSA